MKNYTGLLHPDVGTQQNPGAAAFFNDRLWYIANGHNSGVWTMSRKLDHVNPDDTKHESDYWTNDKTDDQQGLKDKIQIDTARQPSLVVANGYMYLIWVQKHEHDKSGSAPRQEATSVWATRMNPGDANSKPSWSAPVRLTDVNPNNPIFAFDSNFCVVAWGDYLVGCCHYNTETVFYAFDTTKFPSGAEGQVTKWPAVKSHSQMFYGSKRWPKAGLPESQEELGDQISMDWFAVDGDNIYFVLSLFNEKTKTAYIPVLMQMKSVEEWDYNSMFYHWNVEVWHGISGGVQLKTDPAGRVRAYTLAGEGSDVGKLIYGVLATNQVSPDGLMWGKFGPRNKDGGMDFQDIYKQKQIVDQMAVPCFIWKDNKNYTSKDGKPATASEIYEFLLFKQDNIRLKFSHFGRAVRVPNEEQFNPNGNRPSNEQMYVLMGMVDSPIPLPAVNVKSRPTNYPNQTLGSVIYGYSDSDTKTHSASHTWSVGFQSSGKATNGVGPAWNVAMNYGQGKLNGNQQKDQIFTAMKADTNVGLTTKELNPQGTIFANQVIIHRDAFYFYDYPLEGSSPKVISNAPEVTRIWTQFEQDFITGAFLPFTVDVGNLESYTKSAINKRMQQKFNEYGNKGNIKFEQSDYDNYFDQVINNPKNAISFKNNGVESLYLEFSWGTSGSTSQKYQEMTSSFKENSWTFNSSAYAGVSFGAGVDFFGIGEQFASQYLAGGTYSMNSQLKTTKGNSWGISVNNQLQSPGANAKKGEVTGYSWRLYLLKASQQWTDELIAFGDAKSVVGINSNQLDPGSQPWRIVFVVNDEIDIA